MQAAQGNASLIAMVRGYEREDLGLPSSAPHRRPLSSARGAAHPSLTPGRANATPSRASVTPSRDGATPRRTPRPTDAPSASRGGSQTPSFYDRSLGVQGRLSLLRSPRAPLQGTPSRLAPAAAAGNSSRLMDVEEDLPGEQSAEVDPGEGDLPPLQEAPEPEEAPAEPAPQDVAPAADAAQENQVPQDAESASQDVPEPRGARRRSARTSKPPMYVDFLHDDPSGGQEQPQDTTEDNSWFQRARGARTDISGDSSRTPRRAPPPESPAAAEPEEPSLKFVWGGTPGASISMSRKSNQTPRAAAERARRADEAERAARSQAERGPAEASPAEASPAEASPAEAGPAQAGPAQAGPAEASPAEASPAEAGPAEAGPAQASPAKSHLVGQTPARVSPAKSSPVLQSPRKPSPAKAAARSPGARKSPARSPVSLRRQPPQREPTPESEGLPEMEPEYLDQEPGAAFEAGARHQDVEQESLHEPGDRQEPVVADAEPDVQDQLESARVERGVRFSDEVLEPEPEPCLLYTSPSPRDRG